MGPKKDLRSEVAPIKCAGRESASLPALCIGDSVGKPALSTLESVGLPADSLPAHFFRSGLRGNTVAADQPKDNQFKEESSGHVSDLDFAL